MSNSEDFIPYSEYVDFALRKNVWGVPEQRSLLPDLVPEQLSMPERMKQLYSLMETSANLLHKVPHTTHAFEEENGLNRFIHRVKITDQPGPHPDIPYISFSVYHDAKMNTTGVNQYMDTPYRLVVASKLSDDDTEDVNKAILQKLGKLPREPIAHTFSFFFTKEGEGLVTFTPAVSVGDIQGNRGESPKAFALHPPAIQVARDAMWQLYKKVEALAPLE